MKIFKIYLVVFLTYALGFAGNVSDIGIAGAQQLLIPVGARGVALAGAPVAGLNGLQAIYYNPAGFSTSEGRTEAMFSRMNFIGDIDMTYAAIGAHFKDAGSFALTFRSLDFGDIPETTIQQPEGTGATFSPSYLTIGVTYAHLFMERLKAGLSLNLISETIMDVSATGASVDLGVQYLNLLNVHGLHAGLVLRNFGTPMSYDGDNLLFKVESDENQNPSRINTKEFDLPSQLEFGLSYSQMFIEKFNTSLVTSFLNNNYANNQFKMGLEMGYNDMFFVRAGYAVVQERSIAGADDNIFGPAFGAGFKMSSTLNLVIDYAYRTVDLFDNNQVFTIIIGF